MLVGHSAVYNHAGLNDRIGCQTLVCLVITVDTNWPLLIGDQLLRTFTQTTCNKAKGKLELFPYSVMYKKQIFWDTLGNRLKLFVFPVSKFGF